MMSYHKKGPYWEKLSTVLPTLKIENKHLRNINRFFESGNVWFLFKPILALPILQPYLFFNYDIVGNTVVNEDFHDACGHIKWCVAIEKR